MNIKPSVVNFHFVDFCNYNCIYCFVKKISRMTSFLKFTLIIDNIEKYFHSSKIHGRINLVGGEVFVCSYLQDVIDYAFKKNIDVSLVTNGSLLTKEFIIDNKDKLTSIGISVDSLNEDTNIKIGRCQKNKVLNNDSIIELCECIKSNGIKLKINHCVSKMNIDEDISWFIDKVKPDRFKIFQMTVVEGINDKASDLQINSQEFERYCEKYKHFNPVIENEDEMKSSYLIIDSDGDIYFNSANKRLGNALSDDLYKIIDTNSFNEKAYLKRYEIAKNEL